jgi:translation initiation factor eIF-2B subunit epsilon
MYRWQRHVCEAVVAGIVGQIRIVPGVVAQRKEIANVVDRWGELINKIGGVDGVETVAVLRVRNILL